MAESVSQRNPGTPSGMLIWALRGLVIAGLAIGLFLLWIHLSSWLAMRTATVPLCGWAGWLDCDTVLNSPRWSNWLGIPIVVPAVALYAVMAVAIFTFKGRGSRRDARLWLIMQAATAAAALAAVWFIYVQAGILGRICAWCMAEHAVSLLLAGLVWSQSAGLTALHRLGAGAVAVVAVAVLVGGQLLVSPTYTTQMVVGEVDERGRYVETNADDDRAVVLGHGQVILSRDAHPMLGFPQARHVVVEVIDYTCPRCRRLATMLDEAMQTLGPDYAAMVVTYPLSHRCNPDFAETDERHAHTCAITELAHAVWGTDAAAFAGYHHWLFAEQEHLDADAARAEAERRVGADALAATLNAEPIADLLARDLQIADHLDVFHLPGLVAADQRFEAMPDDSAELARLIRRAFE